MNLPSRLPAAAREAALARWPAARLVRVGRAWAVVGHVSSEAQQTDLCTAREQPELPRGWFSVLVADHDGDASAPRIWWTGASWRHRRRRDAIAAAVAAEQDIGPAEPGSRATRRRGRLHALSRKSTAQGPEVRR